MKLLTTEITARGLVDRIEERLRARGLLSEPASATASEQAEVAIDPLSFNLQALERHADPTQGLPLETHRGGVGRAVILAKWVFRKSCQVFINEALARQKLFNGNVRDSYAQLSADLLRLRKEVATLRGSAPPAKTKPPSHRRRVNPR